MNAPFDHANEPPLVSVIAISYNQSKWVIGALNSVLNQDYERIELIVSDDGSNDGTPELVEDWLKQHSTRFHCVRLLTSTANEGICRNLAKGVAAAHGTWIKGIACDDILCKDAISKFIEQTQRDRTELAFSQITKFRAEGEKLTADGNLLTNDREINLIRQPSALLKSIRRENFLPAPGAFYSRRLLDAAGGIDTSFKHLDDWPLWLRILPLVQRVSWIDKPLVLYRISEKSISQNQKSKPIGELLYSDRQRLYQQLQRSQLAGLEFWHIHLQMLRQRVVFETLGNSRLGYKLLISLQILSPLTWMGIVKRTLHALNLVRENAIPLARGAYYFGLSGLRRRIRVFGPISMRIPRSLVNIGQRVIIHEGVALIGKKGTNSTISIGSFSTLEKNSYLNAHGGSIVLGDHVHVGVGCVLQGYGGLKVGENTMFGPNSQVYTSNHRTSSPSLPRNLLGEKPRSVTIGCNCWIAANCIVLPGSRIPDESLIPVAEVVRRKVDKSVAVYSQPIGELRHFGK